MYIRSVKTVTVRLGPSPTVQGRHLRPADGARRGRISASMVAPRSAVEWSRVAISRRSGVPHKTPADRFGPAVRRLLATPPRSVGATIGRWSWRGNGPGMGRRTAWFASFPEMMGLGLRRA